MTLLKPKSPLHFLSEQSVLQTVIYDNHFKTHGNDEPLNEFRDVMREFARDYAKTFFSDKYYGELTQEEIEKFEQKFYGKL